MFARPQSVLWVGETIDTISSHREEELLQGLSAEQQGVCVAEQTKEDVVINH